MKNFRKSAAFVLLTVAATALSSCGKKEKEVPANYVSFWSSFGATYKNALNDICGEIEAETGLDIDHKSQGSYPEIRREMISAIAVGDYPHIAMGYPDHFAQYLASGSSGILTPLDDYLTEDVKNDYYEEYMIENHMYNNKGKDTIYGVPFNKSTELLGYNGVFVDYCASKEADLAIIPNTWGEWAEKGERYNNHFNYLMGQKKGLFGVQNVEGKASEFELADTEGLGTDQYGNVVLPNGKKLLIDFTKADPSISRLMSWDATDNAFITLIKQWGAKYTVLPEDQKNVIPKRRIGHVLFGNNENIEKVVDCLQFFNGLAKKKIFGTPKDLGGSFSSDAYKLGRVMFMVCSSGGLSYNTAKWNHRFRVHTIPYKDEQHKEVISQGANICMTNAKGNKNAAWEVIKDLTTGKFQTEWCLTTGYYPASKSAANSEEYQAFLNEATEHPETAYANPTRVAYREGSVLNTKEYMDPTKGWHKFVDDAFVGSSIIREVVEGILNNVFTGISEANLSNRQLYKDKISDALNDERITTNKNIHVE